MISMQYKIRLSDDFDMNIIRKRVAENGYKMDGFQDLFFKAYLISEKTDDNQHNEYAPLYLWKDSEGMNKFIFDGFYDNILNSFGWQKIDVAIPMIYELAEDLKTAKFVLENRYQVEPTQKMHRFSFLRDYPTCKGKLLVYNPEKWQCVEYYFFDEMPTEVATSNQYYQILHLST